MLPTAAALLAALPTAVSAAPGEVTYLTPHNGRTCGSWVAQRRNGDLSIWQIEAWGLGLLSGSAAVQRGSDFLNGVEPDGVYGWVDNYCKDHPLAPLTDALVALANDRGIRGR